MNAEQLQDYLTELSTHVLKGKAASRNEEVEQTRKFLMKTEEKTRLIIHYVNCNYTDVDLVQPLVAQILALYYRGGYFRQYALQYIPAFIGVYLMAASKKQHKSTSILETFFLAIYNEEILDPIVSNVYAKKVEEVRIPSIRFPSIYHDPSKLNTVPEITTLKPGGTPSVQSTVRLGPFPTMERFNAENKFIILSRIMRSVNASMCFISSDVVGRFVCLCTLIVCLSGFHPPEMDLRAKVLPPDTPSEVLDDYSKKPRIAVSSLLLVELLTSVYLALYNGSPDLALRALDAAHQRAQFEFMPDLLLVTSSMRNSLLESSIADRKEDFFIPRKEKLKLRKELVTNASLRMKRLPDDIPVMETKEKEHSALDDIVEGMDHLKKKMQSHAHKIRNRRKSTSTDEEIELQTIAEDPSSVVEERTEKKEEKERERPDRSERGTFAVQGFRHADSLCSSARSVDHG